MPDLRDALSTDWTPQHLICEKTGLSGFAAKKRLKLMQERGEVERRVVEETVEWRKKEVHHEARSPNPQSPRQHAP